MNKLKIIKIIIYRLKRDFGVPITIKYPSLTSYNVQTGATTRSYIELSIVKAIVLTSRQIRKIPNLAGTFKYGGAFDTNERLVIIDEDDLGSYEPELNHSIIYNNKYYTIISPIQAAEDINSYLLKIKRTEGQSV